MMNSRKILLDALNHRSTQRIPLDFDGTPCSGMHVTCVAALREYYGLEKRPVKVCEPFQMLGQIDEDLKQIIGVDTEPVRSRNTFFGFPNENWREYRLDNGLEVLVPEKFTTTKDAAGNHYIYPQGDINAMPSGKMPKDGFYFDAIIRQQPFAEEELDPLDNLEEFGEISKEDLEYFHAEAVRARATSRGVVANFGGTGLGDIALVPGTSLKKPRGIRDIEEWYISTVTRQDYLHEVFTHQTDIALKNLQKLSRATGDLVDVVFICGTDFGTQTGTFCSPAVFQELYMPYYRKINNWIHENTGWKTFKHCCGAIETFLEMFIESGFDIINPVQCSAAGMEPAYLKRIYGDRLVFWGGGVDTQKVLPFGTPDDVRTQVLERCRIFSERGGFVFNAIHNVQAMTPVANIAAMIETVKSFSW